MTSSPKSPRSKSSSQRERDRAGAVQVKCRFCGNTFMAKPKLAVCVKCGRPANKPLPKSWLAASFFIPVLGFVYSLVIRPHSPFAANQGLWAAVFGSALFTAVYFVLHEALKVF